MNVAPVLFSLVRRSKGLSLRRWSEIRRGLPFHGCWWPYYFWLAQSLASPIYTAAVVVVEIHRGLDIFGQPKVLHDKIMQSLRQLTAFVCGVYLWCSEAATHLLFLVAFPGKRQHPHSKDGHSLERSSLVNIHSVDFVGISLLGCILGPRLASQ